MTLTYVGNNTETANQTNYTFSSESIGAQQTGRYIIVVTEHNDVSSVTVGGDSATKIVESNDVALWWLSYDNANTTADIVVTGAGSSGSCSIAVWQIYNGATITVHDSGTATGNSGSVTTSVNTIADGAAVVIGNFFGVGSVTFSANANETERFDFEVEAATQVQFWGGDDTVTDGASTVYGVTMSDFISAGHVIVASFR